MLRWQTDALIRENTIRFRFFTPAEPNQQNPRILLLASILLPPWNIDLIPIKLRDRLVPSNLQVVGSGTSLILFFNLHHMVKADESEDYPGGELKVSELPRGDFPGFPGNQQPSSHYSPYTTCLMVEHKSCGRCIQYHVSADLIFWDYWKVALLPLMLEIYPGE